MLTLTPGTGKGRQIKGALLSNVGARAHVQYPLKTHDRVNQLMQQLVIFLTASMDVLLSGDVTNSTTSFDGATMSNFASRIKPIRRLHAVTCKPPMFTQPVCTACSLPFCARSQVDGSTLSTTPYSPLSG